MIGENSKKKTIICSRKNEILYLFRIQLAPFLFDYNSTTDDESFKEEISKKIRTKYLNSEEINKSTYPQLLQVSLICTQLENIDDKISILLVILLYFFISDLH